MKSKFISLGIVGLLVIGGLIGILNFLSVEVQSTYVSGTYYDGSGGPWTVMNSPYIVVGDILVPAGETLTIEPGVQVRFDGYYNFYVEGSLLAIGTASDMIIISSNKGMPEPGDWDKIMIEPIGFADIRHCEISYGCLGIFLKSPLNQISYNNFIMNNDFGLYMDNSSCNEIYENSFFNNGLGIHGHQIESWNTHNIDTTNTVNGKPIYYLKDQTGGTVPPGAGQVILANCSDMLIEGQELTFASIGIELGFSSNIHITDNHVSSNDRLNEGMNSSGNPNATEGSTINFCGIYLFNSHGNTINDNFISENDKGIRLEYSNWNTIEDNDLYFNKQVIYVFWSSNVSVLDNDINGTFGHDSSVHPFRSSDILISDNRILNGGHTIFIQNSNRVIVTQNHISSGNSEGVRLEGAENIVITHNDIMANGLGIRMFYPFTHNVIHHNNIIDNDIQAIDWESSQWDDGYPSGGNYWSDYSGIDMFKGPNQDIPGSDGIGDTPYIIDGDSQDNYPLMNPAGHDLESYALCVGWNMVSTPLIQSNAYFEYVLSSISGSYDVVQWYNNEDESDQWKYNHISKSLSINDLDDIDHSMGLWVHVTDPEGVTFDNFGFIPQENQTIPLHPGWNMVGYPSLSSHNRTVGLNNLEFNTDVDCIQWYDAATKEWHFMGPEDHFSPGRGYWVHAITESVWEVPL